MRPVKNIANLLLRPFKYETVALGNRQKTSVFWIQQQLMSKKNPVIFDGGANRGHTASRYLKLYPGATLHLFEPFGESFDLLKQRFEGNPAVKMNQAALSDVEGMVSLNSNQSSYTNSILKSDPLAGDTWGEGVLTTQKTVMVPTITIDAYAQANSVSAIDILKLDIQGAELKALQGTRSLFSKKAVGLVYMELILGATYLGQPKFEDYLHFFTEQGYVLLDIFNPFRKDFRLIQADVIFVPDPAHVAGK